MRMETEIHDEFSFVSWVMPLLTAALLTFLTFWSLPEIHAALSGDTHVWEKSMNSIPSESNEHDILCYVSNQLPEVDFEGSSQEVFTSLAGSSGQIFEWAQLACAYIRGDDNAGAGLEPHKCFNAILTHSKTNHVPLLGGMYRFTLETIFPKEQLQGQCDHSLKRFRSVMVQILGTMEPFSPGSLASMRHHFKDLAEINIHTIVAPIAALLSGATDSCISICSLHASFADFLMDRDWSHEFFVNVHPIHNDLAFASLGIMMKNLQFNICNLPSSHLPNSKVMDLDGCIKKCIPAELAYSCQFWTEHVQHAQFNSALAEEIQAFFNHKRLLFWFEVLSLLKVMNTCAGSLSSVIQCVMVCRMTSCLEITFSPVPVSHRVQGHLRWCCRCPKIYSDIWQCNFYEHSSSVSVCPTIFTEECTYL